MKRTALLVLAAAALVAASVGGAMASGLLTASDQPVFTPRAKTDSVLPQLRSSLAVFRGPTTAADRRVRRSKAMRASAAALPFGANMALARAGTRTESGDVLALVPTPTGLCVGTRRIGIVGCSTLSSVLAAKTTGTVICAVGMDPHGLLVHGVVPDAITRATVTREGARDVSVPVRSNSFAFETRKSAPRPLEVVLQGPDRLQREPALVPADARDDVCAGG